MKNFNPSPWGVVVGASILALVNGASNAKAELVYEDSVPAAANTNANNDKSSRIDEQSTLRETMSASQKAKDTVLSQASSKSGKSGRSDESGQSAESTSAFEAEEPATEVQNMSRSELLRRERVRAEVKNEDMLQERLEELRLRDERSRTDQLLGGGAPTTVLPPVPSPVPAWSGNTAPNSVPMVEQVVTTPVTEHPGQIVGRPAGNGTEGQQEVSQYSPLDTASTSSAHLSDVSDESTRVTLQPRFGLSQMAGQSFGYDVRPRFSTGVLLGVSSSEIVSFEVGYNYSEFGIVMNGFNPYIQYIANPYAIPQRAETVVMKQNLVDLGMKLYLLGSASKVRPFIGAGAAYSFSYVNYDERLLSQNLYLRQWMGQDYEVKSFLGTLSAGLDIRVSRSISVGMAAKYYNVLTSREQGWINNAILWGGYPMGGVLDADKQYIGGTLARMNFYSVMGSVTFAF